MIKLLNCSQKAGYVKEVGKRKKAAKLPEFRPEREVEIIERMCEKKTSCLIRVFHVRVLLHSGWRLYQDVGRWKKAGDSLSRTARNL